MSDESVSEDVVAKAGPRRRCWRPILLCLLLLVLTTWVWWWWSASSELAEEIAKIRARGEPVYFSELAPEPVDSEKDAAPYIMAEMSRLEADELPWLTDIELPLSHEEFDAFRQAVAHNRAELDAIESASRRPYFRLPFDYDHPYPAALQEEMEAGPFYLLKYLLSAQTAVSLAEGDNEAAVRAIELKLRLAELMRDIPLSMPQHVRLAYVGGAVDDLQLLLSAKSLTADHFGKLDHRLGAFEETFTVTPWFLAERAMLVTTLNNPPPAPIEGARRIQTFLEMLSLPLRPWNDHTKTRVLQAIAPIVDRGDEQGPEVDKHFDECQEEILRLCRRSIPLGFFAPSYQGHRKAGLRVSQLINMGRLAMRVERYRAEHGSLPEELADVLDEELPEMPLCPFNGVPFGYYVAENGFVIYDYGRDGLDGGLMDEKGRRSSPDEKLFLVDYAELVKAASDDDAELHDNVTEQQ